MSVDYYNTNAKHFFNETYNLDMQGLYSEFIEQLPKKGCVLDAGCGSGRDAEYFSNLGFNVTAFDASSELVTLAREKTGLNILHLDFNEFKFRHKFDGIWACASLLHVNKKNLRQIINKYLCGLNVAGTFYMSFKLGDKSYDKNGRHFNCFTEDTLRQLLLELNHNISIRIWLTNDVRNYKENEKWLNAILRLN